MATIIVIINSVDCLLKDEHSATKRIIFTYPMVAYTDMEESLKTDVLEICTNACEKYINDNQSVSYKQNIFSCPQAQGSVLFPKF